MMERATWWQSGIRHGSPHAWTAWLVAETWFVSVVMQSGRPLQRSSNAIPDSAIGSVSPASTGTGAMVSGFISCS